MRNYPEHLARKDDPTETDSSKFFNFVEHPHTTLNDVPEIPEEIQAKYATFLAGQNYFAGMRVSTINAELEGTNEFWFEGQLQKRTNPFHDLHS